MPAPSVRLIPVIVAVVLLPLACGGEDDDQPEQAADTQPATSTTQGEPQDTTDPDDPAEAEDQTTTEPDATREVEQQEEADPISEPEQEQTNQPASTSTHDDCRDHHDRA